jgi:uncharacterized membrane protein
MMDFIRAYFTRNYLIYLASVFIAIGVLGEIDWWRGILAVVLITVGASQNAIADWTKTK